MNVSLKPICNRCQHSPPTFEAIRSRACYEGVLQHAIRKLKYSGNLGLGESLAVLLSEVLINQSWLVDLVTEVPLDTRRSKERGYNQSELLSRPLAYRMGIKYSNKAIRRIRLTRPQVGLSNSERIMNVENAFKADEKIVSGKSILVIDDVITTGATINSCASALLEASAQRIYGITLARAARVKIE